MLSDYIDQAKKKQGIKSDSKLADQLGIGRAAVSKWRNGAPISEESIVKLSRLCGEKPEVILAAYELQKSHTPEMRSMWERISGQAAVFFLASVSASFLVAERSFYILCKIIKSHKRYA